MKKLKKFVSLLLVGALALLALTACGGSGSNGAGGPNPTGDELVDATNQTNYAFRQEITGGVAPAYLTSDADLNTLAAQMYQYTLEKLGSTSSTSVFQAIAYGSGVSTRELLAHFQLDSEEYKICSLYPHADAEEAGISLYRTLYGAYENGIYFDCAGSYKAPYNASYGYLVILHRSNTAE